MRGQSGERLIQRLNRIGIGAWRPGALLPYPEGSPALVTSVQPAADDPRQARIRLPTYHEAIVRLADEAVARKMAGRRRAQPAAAAAAPPSQPEPAAQRPQRPPLSDIFNVVSQWDAAALTPRDDAVIQVMMDLNDDVEADVVNPQPPPAAAAASSTSRVLGLPMPTLENVAAVAAASDDADLLAEDVPRTPVLVPATPERAASVPPRLHADPVLGMDPSADVEW